MSKPRVVKDYDKLDVEIQEQIKLAYPHGFERKLIKFTNAKGQLVSALPFETEDKYYLIRMTLEEARGIIEEDDDYDEDGHLKDDIKATYEEKYDEEFAGDDDLDIAEEEEETFDTPSDDDDDDEDDD